MLNTGLIVGVKREFFEEELKKVTLNIKKTQFKNSAEAFETTLEHFFEKHGADHRSDVNSNSCIIIKDFDDSNQLEVESVKFRREDFAEFVKKCKNYPHDSDWFSIKIALAFKNMAKIIKFEDVRLFVMNYS